jgi:hypothetical protein
MLFDSYGMRAVITDTTDLYVEDWSPQHETHYNARFYFDPNSVSIPNNGSFYILSSSNLRMSLKNNAGVYQLRADTRTDSDTWANGTFINITAALATLPFHHRDPFDRLIAVQAKVEGLPLVSADPSFDLYSVKRIW